MPRPSLLTAALLACASPAAAQPVGGVLPLKHGAYVEEGSSCRSPAFAVLQSYDGRGIGDPHSRDCRLKVLGRRGGAITARNTCIDAGAGPAPRSSETLTLRLEGADRYALLTPGQPPARFRWCPQATVSGR